MCIRMNIFYCVLKNEASAVFYNLSATLLNATVMELDPLSWEFMTAINGGFFGFVKMQRRA
jgi:hypothetical protein